MIDSLRILIGRWWAPFRSTAAKNGENGLKRSKTVRLTVGSLRRAGVDVHVRAQVVGRRDHREARRLGIERPLERAQAAGAELLVDRRLLRGAIGEFRHDHVDIEALPAGELV